MNIGELREEIRNLAFEDADVMWEYAGLVNEAINRAVREIHSTVRPILGKLVIQRPNAEKAAYVRYNLNELAEDFMLLSGRITREADGVYVENQRYKTEGISTLLLPGGDTGTFNVWYKRKPRTVDADTPKEEELELDYDLHILVPFLAAFYVWLEDDERKATIYYNRYEELKTQLAVGGMKAPAAEIEGGMRW